MPANKKKDECKHQRIKCYVKNIFGEKDMRIDQA